MKANKKLPLLDVMIITNSLCEYFSGEECEIVKKAIPLKENDEIKYYNTVVVCKKEDSLDLVNELISKSNVDKDEFSIDKKFCHITTYDFSVKDSDEISFDLGDDYPIKASFGGNYRYIYDLFNNFIEFRNKLINSKQIVKEDDIYQYFNCIIEKEKRNKEGSLSRMDKIKRYFKSKQKSVDK